MSSDAPQHPFRDDDAAEAEFDRAFELSELSRFEEAAAFAVRGLAIRPDAVHGLNILAFVQSRLGDHEAARATSARALALDPEDAWANYTRGIVLWSDGDGESALECFDRAIELWPESAYMHAMKAELLGSLDRPDEGLEEIDVALAMEPDSAEHRLKKIDLLRALRRGGAADEVVAEAMRLAPCSPAVHRRAAATALRQDRPEDALRLFRSALAADADDEEAREGVLEALEAHGERRFLVHSGWIFRGGLLAAIAWWFTFSLPGAVVIVVLALLGPTAVRDVAVARHQLGRVAMPWAEKFVVVAVAGCTMVAAIGLVGELTPFQSALRPPMLAAIVVAGMFVVIRTRFRRWLARPFAQVPSAGLLCVLALIASVVTALFKHWAGR